MFLYQLSHIYTMPNKPQTQVRRVIKVESTSQQSPEIVKLFHEGLALHQLGKINDAKIIYEKILEKQINHFDALQLLAVTYAQKESYAIALKYFDLALKINQTNEIVLNNRGNVLKELNLLDDALKSYDEALRIKPDFVDAHNNRGRVLRELNRLDDALKSYDEALRIKPDFADAHNNRGNVSKELKRLDDTLKSYDEALRIKPDFADAYNNRGVALKELKRFDDALKSYDEALQIKPNFADAYNNRGVILKELKRPEDALKSYDEAIRIKPDFADAYNNRGNVLIELKRPDDALNSYDEAIRIKPDFADAYNNRGLALKELKRLDDALKSYNEALRIKPDYTPVLWNKSLLMILDGEYIEGWSLYEVRTELEDKKNNYYKFSQPSWRGKQNLKNKTLLIYSEQGFGDVIQFVRYLKDIHKLGIKIILEIPKTLISLVSTLNVPMTVVEKGKKLPEFDAHCPLLSLPYVFQTTVKTIPAHIPYLFSDNHKVKNWKNKLGKQINKRIGLVWSGSTQHAQDYKRSISLDTFAELIKLPFEWHSLQKEYRDKDKEFLRLHPELHQHQDDLKDFSDTAALIECLDLIISVDTSVAHVAGSLGKPVWILLPFIPDYRWMLDREDCPWYPSARLFRHNKNGNWSDLLKLLAIELCLPKNFSMAPPVIATKRYNESQLQDLNVQK